MNHLAGTSLGLSLLLTGCGAGSELAEARTTDAGASAAPSGARTVRWVGVVEDTDVRVAVLAGPGKARLYFCGGPVTHATATRWFDIAFDGGEHIDFQEDGWRVHAHLAGGNVAGEVELGDNVTRWLSAQPVSPNTIAGLYEGNADCGRVGLIVNQPNKDSVPKAQGACAGTTAQPINPVLPLSAESERIHAHSPGESGEVLTLQIATLDPL